jgi:ABC-2 type transport system permease protein
LAGHRDLGDSVFPDKDSAKPRTGLLHSPLGLSLRMSRLSSLSWLTGISLMALFYGFITKTATQAFNALSNKADKAISKVLQVSQQHIGAELYLAIVFLFIMVVMMVYAANAVGAMREDEAEGYLDNLFVRPISRLRWLAGRFGITIVGIAFAGILSTIAVWIGIASQHVAISFHTLLLAGVNTMAPAVFTLGIAVLALGLVPRLTTFIGYGIIAWSFLIQLLSSGTTFNHWLLDTSVLQHVPLAPAASPNWTSAAILVGLGFAAALIGAAVFQVRDLQTA